ncbi:uncharacterized protein K460DRAFT_284235 [Cucurbitaria berberidis CBS 394.84]|uniref:Heterokaryon incompatibility domain-containing protein n=1 Tax=Cucurbitaria berberidis CBS 394.84 TaxID=1168544 RepID=A0A9P4GFE6_9PLEO|nr:uncharacterized protein K460DRAFT_284235 [Cucurbitaria berberidis CBS 394.84]KAF1845058.1 hypothetical protein K460DRAFT_284235 [Cucurbitaria berberidis CBS 394.84]
MATPDESKQTLKASLRRLTRPFRLSKPELESTLSTESSTTASIDRLITLPIFQYNLLDTHKKSVRLLEILPGSDFEPISVRLLHCDLEDKPRYIALSYTWDQGSQEKYIQCQGTKIGVGENLWQFLHQYRQKTSIEQYREKSPDSTFRLWIDAVCINQNSNAERSHQVSLMRDIYMGADSVIVWLGLAQKNDELAFLLTRYPNLLSVDEISTALIQLLNKSYWSRVWVVQEFVLAKTVKIWCGEFQADAADFESLWHDDRSTIGLSSLSQQILDSGGWLLFSHRRDFRHSRVYKRKPHGGRNSKTLKATFRLRDLLQSFSSSKSSEVNDKVYGFLGIATTGPGEPIRPDYSKTPVELLVDVLRNQGNEKTASGEDDNHNFVTLLMSRLNVSRMQFARHVIQNSPEMEPFIYVLANAGFMVASLSLPGTIVEIGSSVHRAEAFQENMWMAGSLSRSPMHPGGLSNSDIRDLGSLATFPETRLALEFEDYHIENAVHRGRSEKLRQCSVAKSTNTIIQSLIDQNRRGKESILEEVQERSQIDSKDLRQIFSRSFSNGTALISSAWQRQSEWDTQARYEQYTTFMGTNNIIGILCTSGSPNAPQVMPDDYICVFSDDIVSKNALIIQHDEMEQRWIIVGFAVITTSISDTEPRGVVHFCFHCHLTDILELSRCGILSETQLERLLKQSLEDGNIGDIHQCSLGIERYPVLEFGL